MTASPYRTPLRGFSPPHPTKTTGVRFLRGPLGARRQNGIHFVGLLFRKKNNSNDDQGFTLSELLVVIILTAFFSILIMTFTFEYWRYAYLLQADLDTL